MSDLDRLRRGQEKLKEFTGDADGALMNALKDISPDLARYTVEFGYGDIYSRPGLDLRSRSIATIAALTTLGYALPELKVHIKAGLNVGLTQEEIKEIIIQMTAYAGFPAALNAMLLAKEVFNEVNS